MKMKFLGVMMLAALFTTAGVSAQEKEKAHGKKEGMFKKLDTDSDGKISMAEAEKAPKRKLKDNFAAIDTNKDSFLYKEELKAYRKQKKMEKLEKLK